MDPLRGNRPDEAITLGSASQIDSWGLKEAPKAHVSVLFGGIVIHWLKILKVSVKKKDTVKNILHDVVKHFSTRRDLNRLCNTRIVMDYIWIIFSVIFW